MEKRGGKREGDLRRGKEIGEAGKAREDDLGRGKEMEKRGKWEGKGRAGIKKKGSNLAVK